ncbi:DEAD/DEAH box helicase [Erwinia endophytica]|uniref:DEAD/DEAH box helicase n=1 Tax=Erwinia endophytica TaxID=1563158 RepID=UPI001265F331|nr:DEAD/DEAH box helicase [Erwinia endophytica]KAB8306734.1 DEAD/DEAH box helicase [Erwinia endophytica]
MKPWEFTSADVTRDFGSKTVVKAQPYIGAFSKMVTERTWISGTVKGTARQNYQVYVHVTSMYGGLTLSGQCSCPVQWQCKHAAALALTWLARAAEMTQGGINYALVEWAERFRQQRGRQAKATKRPTHALVYGLAEAPYQDGVEVRFLKAKLNKQGDIGEFDSEWSNARAAVTRRPAFITDDDLIILQMLLSTAGYVNYASYPLQGKNGARILDKILATDRCVVMPEDILTPVTEVIWLKTGAVRQALPGWQPLQNDLLQASLAIEPPADLLILVDPPCYLDRSAGEIGPLTLDLSFSQLQDFLAVPTIRQQDAEWVAEVFEECAAELPAPPWLEKASIRHIDAEPVPCLQLSSQYFEHYNIRHYIIEKLAVDFAKFSFDYEGIAVEAGSTKKSFSSPSGERVMLKRAEALEKTFLSQLQKAGLNMARLTDYSPAQRKVLPEKFYTVNDPNDPGSWLEFIHKALPKLRAKGWRIEMDADFSFNFTVIDQIDGSVTLDSEGWFDVEMGVLINQRVVSLVPMLSELFKRDLRWRLGDISAIPDDEAIMLYTERREKVLIKAQRLKGLVSNLVDLIVGSESDKLRVSSWDAGRLATLEDSGRWQFNGESAVLSLARRLQQATGLQPVEAPAGLNAQLRDYQLQGLSWMQYLRQHDLSGVLADDMGLGKTIQTLAHIQLEKEAGRLDKPALIVMPTTLVYNWQHEAARFTPGLNVLALNGPQRTAFFDRLADFDVILSTYALVWRDRDALAAVDYHLLILDEAQYVKNSRTQAAQAIRAIQARHRLCLTGTPLENHLGELWSQFDFLLPGFLGSAKEFTQRWRTPVEKEGNQLKRTVLARRIRPFMLRRSKNEVAGELPPKNVMVRSVGLEGAQRDLYEAMRVAMQQKIREAIAEQGLARSHIVVLDALLKLRQVCCDPRLVKLPGAKKVNESAKLDMLREMVKELIAEGRKILLFSQFSEMLTLIAEAMDKLKIPYVMLTGETRDRQAAVARFQNGEVPLFLISLKAGGVGLNLTAADAVIHYDPWWNPAAENQATDRAHRIGQDKTVFVYKLVVAGSIEEKIVALQEKKASLAHSILTEDGAVAAKFSEEEIGALFEPF